MLKDSTLLNINITPKMFWKIRKEISKNSQKRYGNGGENNDISLSKNCYIFQIDAFFA